MRHFCFRLAIGLALLGPLNPSAAATIDIQGEVQTPGPLVLGEPSRLLDALTQAKPRAHAFWLGAHFARQARLPQQTQLKADLLADLQRQQAAASGDGAQCLAQLEQTLTALPVTGRLPQPLDPVALELDPRANRRLQDGDRLRVPARPDHIVVLGLVRQELRLPYRHGQLAAAYLAQAERCPEADRSYAWVIYPDGQTRRIGIAYWNEEPVNLAPGARLFVPLAGKRWDNAPQALNGQIAEFLATQPLP